MRGFSPCQFLIVEPKSDVAELYLATWRVASPGRFGVTQAGTSHTQFGSAIPVVDGWLQSTPVCHQLQLVVWCHNYPSMQPALAGLSFWSLDFSFVPVEMKEGFMEPMCGYGYLVF